MLTAENLVFFAGRRAIIDGVCASFEPGKLHLILGPNGAGKSTLIRLLARLIRPAQGSVFYEGYNAARWPERKMARHRAILSQSLDVAFSITVRELVLMGRYPHFTTNPSMHDLNICNEVMDFFDVAAMADRNYSTLSGGERQRVQFARVLAQIWSPIDGATRHLFLDEPLTFLDIHHQIDFMEKVRTFAAQHDVVVVGVVHDLDLAVQFADHLLLLSQGRILADGPPNQVLTPENLRTAFSISPILLRNPITGRTHLVFEAGVEAQ